MRREPVNGAWLAEQRAREGLGPKPEAPAKGAEPGRILAAIPRADGTELRVSLHSYEGHPYVRIAPWAGGWPVKGKGCTVRLRELADVAAALAKAALEQEGER